MEYLFSGCRQLGNLTLGDNFDVSKVKSLANMFNSCMALDTITGKLKLGADNAATSMDNMFGSCYALTDIPLQMPVGGTARFDNLSSLSGMFAQCRALTAVDLSGWVLPNLSHVNRMFSGCTTLQQVDLSWSGLRVAENNLSITDVFGNVPATATLEIGTATDENTPAVMAKIGDEFPGTVTSGSAAVAILADLDQVIEEAPAAEAPTEGTPAEEIPAEEIPAEEIPAEEIPAGEIPTEEIPTEEIPAEEASAEETSLLSAVQTRYASLLRGSPRSATNANIVVHDEETPPSSTFKYLVRVKYVGDVGARSGVIQMHYPLPDYVKPINAAGNVITDVNQAVIGVSAAEYSGAATGYLGGRVTTAPHLVLENGQYVLRGSFEGLFTGNEIEVTILCKNEYVTGGFDANGYMYWDGTAYARDSAASATSNLLRLWYENPDLPDAPPTVEDLYTLSYQFEGDVPPDAEAPQGSVHKATDPVTAAAAPTTSYAYYTFDGWYRSDTNAKVNPGDALIMPTENLILTGKWGINEALAPKVTVTYAYSGTYPTNVPTIPESQVMVGDLHYIVQILEDVDKYIFGGWTPTLSVGGSAVVLTTSDGGRTYTGFSGADTYIIDMASGVLQTEQFRNATNLTVSFTGTWRPYAGTIQFDPNGGTGNMADMTNVAFNTAQALTANLH